MNHHTTSRNRVRSSSDIIGAVTARKGCFADPVPVPPKIQQSSSSSSHTVPSINGSLPTTVPPQGRASNSSTTEVVSFEHGRLVWSEEVIIGRNVDGRRIGSGFFCSSDFSSRVSWCWVGSSASVLSSSNVIIAESDRGHFTILLHDEDLVSSLHRALDGIWGHGDALVLQRRHHADYSGECRWRCGSR